MSIIRHVPDERLLRPPKMLKQLVIPVCLTVVFLALLFVFAQPDRYALIPQPGEGGNLYKIDKRTGKIWWIVQARTFAVADAATREASETPEQRAIRLAQWYIPPGTTLRTEETIRNSLQTTKGTLRIRGWRADKVDDQTYLVVYVFDKGAGTQSGGWVFEVNLEAEIVRSVIGDAELEKRFADWAENHKR